MRIRVGRILGRSGGESTIIFDSFSLWRQGQKRERALGAGNCWAAFRLLSWSANPVLRRAGSSRICESRSQASGSRTKKRAAFQRRPPSRFPVIVSRLRVTLLPYRVYAQTFNRIALARNPFTVLRLRVRLSYLKMTRLPTFFWS